MDISECNREKYWHELSSEEKLEKLADRLQYLQRIVNSQAEIIQKMENHVHVSDRIFFGQGPVSPLGWPNNNILNREERTMRRIDQ
jgi:hypothetical protein